MAFDLSILFFSESSSIRMLSGSLHPPRQMRSGPEMMSFLGLRAVQALGEPLSAPVKRFFAGM